MAASSYHAVLSKALSLSPQERLKLVTDLSAELEKPMAKKTFSIMELEGLGAEIWKVSTRKNM